MPFCLKINISFSLPGHGESSKPLEIDHYTIKAYHNTILKLLESLNVSRCIWIGNSMGGVLGYEMLKERPNIIDKLITNGTASELIMSKSTIKLVCFLDKFLIKLLKFEGYIKFASKHSSKIETAQNEIYFIFKKSTPRAIISSHAMLGNYSYLNTINNTNVPIVIIRGQYDTEINKYLKNVDNVIQSNENVKIVEFEGVGHIANIEKPLEYNRLVSKLISESF